MTRPHPVVGLAAELAHGCGRSADEADIPIYFIQNEIIDVLVVETGDDRTAVGVVRAGLLHELLAPGVDLLVGLAVLEGRGYVLHAFEEGNRKAGNGKFHLAVEGPISVFQIIVLRGREALDAAVTAVVVGYEQAFAGNNFTGASPAELHDGVFEGRMVYGIDVVRGEAAAEVAHRFGVELLEKRKEPHALVGACGKGDTDGQRQDGKYLFHGDTKIPIFGEF